MKNQEAGQFLGYLVCLLIWQHGNPTEGISHSQVCHDLYLSSLRGFYEKPTNGWATDKNAKQPGSVFMP